MCSTNITGTFVIKIQRFCISAFITPAEVIL